MVLKPLPHLHSPCERVGGAFFIGLIFWAILQGFVGDIYIFKVSFVFYKFDHLVLALPSFCVFVHLSLCVIFLLCVLICDVKDNLGPKCKFSH
jgi:hypothetical protein